MIQRIQTVWWLLSAILLGIFIFFPIIVIDEIEFSPIEYVKIDFTSMFLGLIDITYTSVSIVLLTVLSIFLFKKRKIQIWLGYFSCILYTFLVFLLFHFNDYLIKEGQKFAIAMAILLLSITFQILAIRAVKKDEALIKSMDRLR